MINKALAKNILQMARLDQRARKTGEGIGRIDKVNTARMKEIIRKFGWPTISLVGKRASRMAWLLAQHADSDVNFQKQCLRLIKKAAKMEEASWGDVAFLTDRMLVSCGKPQKYGTQFRRGKNGKWIPFPIANPKKLDERRDEMGLGSHEKYQKKLVSGL